MSNITSTNDLWGRTWRFNSVIDSAPGTIYVNLKVFPYGPTYGTQRYVEWYYDGNKGFKGVVNANNGKVIDTWYGTTVEIQYGGSTRVAYNNGHWTSDYGTSPRVIKFVEKPEGVSFIDHDDFITWWNANTVEYSLPVQYKGLFDDIADEIRAKDGTTAEINPLLFPIRIRAIEGGTPASGTIEITSNGVHDVTEYASADVNVPIPEGYIIPEGTITITENGTHDITAYASAEVLVESGGGGIEIPTVSNIALSADGTITWDAPDLTDLADLEPTVTYLVTVNDSAQVEVENTNYCDFYSLVEGDNTITVIVKARVRQDSESTEFTTVYSKPDPVSTTWSNTLPSPRYNGGTARVGNIIYYFGGQSSSYTSDIYKINVDTEEVTTCSTKLPVANALMGVAVVDNIIYLFGGNASNARTAVYKFDTTTETITKLSASIPSISEVYYCGVIGDYIYYGTNSTLYKFSITDETVSTVSSSLGWGGYGHGCIIGTDIYYLHGSTEPNYFVKYDTVTNTSTKLSGQWNTRIRTLAMCSSGNCIYMFGGYEGSSVCADIRKYDISTNTFTTLTTTLPESVQYTSAVCIGQHFYIIGGCGSGTNYPKNTIHQVSYI